MGNTVNIEEKAYKLVEWFKQEGISLETARSVCFAAEMKMHLAQPEIQAVLEDPELARKLLS